MGACQPGSRLSLVRGLVCYPLHDSDEDTSAKPRQLRKARQGAIRETLLVINATEASEGQAGQHGPTGNSTIASPRKASCMEKTKQLHRRISPLSLLAKTQSQSPKSAPEYHLPSSGVGQNAGTLHTHPLITSPDHDPLPRHHETHPVSRAEPGQKQKPPMGTESDGDFPTSEAASPVSLRMQDMHICTRSPKCQDTSRTGARSASAPTWRPVRQRMR